MNNPTFDPVIHAPWRLKICALLSPLEEAEYRVLRGELNLSDSVLSKHISRLRIAGYVRVRKAARNGRQRTWASLTPQGRSAFAAHIEALHQLLSAVEQH